MSNDREPAAPLPFRRLMFMPWRWNRRSKWAWCLVLLMSFPIYLLSAVPVTRFLRQKRFPPNACNAVHWCYDPVWRLGELTSIARRTLNWEDAMMDKLLGPEFRPRLPSNNSFLEDDIDWITTE